MPAYEGPRGGRVRARGPGRGPFLQRLGADPAPRDGGVTRMAPRAGTHRAGSPDRRWLSPPRIRRAKRRSSPSCLASAMSSPSKGTSCPAASRSWWSRPSLPCSSIRRSMWAASPPCSSTRPHLPIAPGGRMALPALLQREHLAAEPEPQPEPLPHRHLVCLLRARGPRQSPGGSSGPPVSTAEEQHAWRQHEARQQELWGSPLSPPSGYPLKVLRPISLHLRDGGNPSSSGELRLAIEAPQVHEVPGANDSA